VPHFDAVINKWGMPSMCRTGAPRPDNEVGHVERSEFNDLIMPGAMAKR
jgi:hypothetical protein